MPTPDLANIMRRAHEIASFCEGDYRARLSYGMSRAWAEAANPELFRPVVSAPLAGTPKQVAWANDVRERILLALEIGRGRAAVGAAGGVECCEIIARFLETATNARWFIQNRSLPVRYLVHASAGRSGVALGFGTSLPQS